MIHLLGSPNCQSTREYCLDGFNAATIRFARVCELLGWAVTLYASEENEAPCQELVTCISKAEIAQFLKGGVIPYQGVEISPSNPLWGLANPRMAEEIRKRKKPGDTICLLGGGSQRSICDANPECMAVEYNIGYHGTFSPYRVYQSQAWRHMNLGSQGQVNDGRFFDAVIPGFFDPAEFPEGTDQGYLVYVGRLIAKKGLKIACDAAQAAGVPLKIIGHGDPKQITYGDYLGPLQDLDRNAIIADAKALICPTVYVEPFGCISPEAQLCGTPVISTDFGGFTETVEHGKTGFRCNLFGEFVDAIKRVESLDRTYIRERAERLYSLQTAAQSFQDYFDRLETLWKDGWNTNPFPVRA
jgi:glycosyltransferase involved in cell wall biosynthesis